MSRRCGWGQTVDKTNTLFHVLIWPLDFLNVFSSELSEKRYNIHAQIRFLSTYVTDVQLVEFLY